MVDGASQVPTDNMDFCEACVIGKSTRIPFQLNKNKTNCTLEHIHTDVCVLKSPSTWSNKSYLSNFHG